MIKDSAKTIVCYGDSNTWGRVPGGDRYPRSVRWVSVLQNLLGDDYEVINEGLSARTFIAEDPEFPERTGITHLKAILKTHRTNNTIDLVIVALGTNDVKNIYNLSANNIGGHLEKTLDLIKSEGINNVLVLAPTEIIAREDDTVDERFENGPKISKELPALFRKVCDSKNCHFLNMQDYITSSKVDGFHLEPEAHQKLAEVLSQEIKKII